jgi:hypothetical protein
MAGRAQYEHGRRDRDAVWRHPDRAWSRAPSSVCARIPGAFVNAFLLSFGVIFLAELGDNSLLMAMTFATR